MRRANLLGAAALTLFTTNAMGKDPPATDDRAAPPATAHPRAAHVELDTAFTTSPHGPTVASFGAALRLRADYRFTNGLGASVGAGLVSTSLTVDGEPTRAGTFPGNVLLGASYERTVRPRLDAGLSLRAGVPLALYHGGIDDNRLRELAYTMATSAQGFREPFVWQMNVVPLVLGAKIVLRHSDWLAVAAELTPAYLVSVNQRPSRAALGAHLDAAVVHHAFTAHAGLHYFASTLPLENRDRDQLALRVGAGVLVARQRYGVDLSLGLDDPYGAAQDAPHPWWGIGLVADLDFGAQR